MLIGRSAECEYLDSALASAARSDAIALVVEGEAGVGKTALLSYAESRADGFTFVRATGVPTEAQLAYGGLLAICRPLLGFLDDLPAARAEALRAALGLSVGAPPAERFLVGAGVLDLLAVASLARPLLILVDDLHWLDVPSAQALLFALRRLEAEPVIAVLAVRTAAAVPARLDGLTRLTLTGLDREASSQLLLTVAPGLAPNVIGRLQVATGGNPLALTEIARNLTAAQRSGRDQLADPLPGPGELQSWYVAQATVFGKRTRRALLITAAAGDATVAAVGRALASRGGQIDDLAPAEDAGWVCIEEAAVRWHHPLVRSAVYYGAALPDRRDAHLAVSTGLDTGDPAWAWHRVAAASGPDEQVAGALDHVAAIARARSAFGTAAAAWEQAARVSERPEDAQRRMFTAADAAWLAGDPARANQILDEALAANCDGGLRGRMLYLRGYSEYAAGSVRKAADLYHQAAGFLSADAELAGRALGEAVLAGWWAGDVSQMLDDAGRLQALAETNPPVGAYARFAAGMALMFGERADEGVPLIEHAVAEKAASKSGVSDPRDIWVIAGLGWLGRTHEGRSAAASHLLELRRQGLLGMLPRLLRILASMDLDEDRWADAAAEAEEGLEWCVELGQSGHRPELLALLATVHAWRGADAACEQLSAEALAEAETHDTQWASLIASRAQGLLALGRGRYEQAAEIFGPIVDVPLSRGSRGPTLASVPDLVEALVRTGRNEDANARAAEFERRLAGTTDPRASALTFRCRALIDLDVSAGERYEQALEAHTSDPDVFVAARTRLLYGEWLRRSGYRRQARRQLEGALEVFDTNGAVPWVPSFA